MRKKQDPQRLFGQFMGGCVCRPDPLIEVKKTAPILMSSEGLQYYDFANKTFQVICKDCGRAGGLFHTRQQAITNWMQEDRDAISTTNSV